MYRTEQERFWSGEFGNEYISRNSGAEFMAAVTARWASIISRTAGVQSILELGANIGNNLVALRALLPNARLEAVEINETAYRRLSTLPGVEAHLGSILAYRQATPLDLAFTSGVLIHINPEELPRAYETLYEASSRYVVICEYYNPVPLEIPYRGHEGKLFKRDFAGELMSQYTDLRLIDYGFVYRRDPVFPGDDLTWFLMEKRHS